MERWIKRGDCFYARFQDDIILISRKRHLLRRMRLEMFQILEELRLGLRYEKTFVGRGHRGFDLLGYHITQKTLSPSKQTQEKAIEKAKRRYAQGGPKSLQMYLKRWRAWAHGDLNDRVSDVNEILNQIMYSLYNEPLIRPDDRSRSIWMKNTVNRRESQPWIKNFSGHCW